MATDERKQRTKTVLAVQSLDGYVHLDLGKGCVAIFRAADYYAAIDRGKAHARALQQARRERQAHAAREAGLLGWITTAED
jgi:hypothetical protein